MNNIYPTVGYKTKKQLETCDRLFYFYLLIEILLLVVVTTDIQAAKEHLNDSIVLFSFSGSDENDYFQDE